MARPWPLRHLVMCSLAILCGVVFGLLPVKLSEPYYYENGIEDIE